MTRYEQGFLTKCAEYGVRPGVAHRMLKRATTGAVRPDIFDLFIPVGTSPEEAQKAKMENSRDYFQQKAEEENGIKPVPSLEQAIKNVARSSSSPRFGSEALIEDDSPSMAQVESDISNGGGVAPKGKDIGKSLNWILKNKAGVGAGAGAIGAGSIGALLGHVLTRDEKKKKRNAMIAGLVSALAGGAGGYYASKKVKA